MRCPDCHQPIMWVPRRHGTRIAVTVAPAPDGDIVILTEGFAVAWQPDAFRDDVPRYASHVPCPEAT